MKLRSYQQHRQNAQPILFVVRIMYKYKYRAFVFNSAISTHKGQFIQITDIVLNNIKIQQQFYFKRSNSPKNLNRRLICQFQEYYNEVNLAICVNGGYRQFRNIFLHLCNETSSIQKNTRQRKIKLETRNPRN